MDSPATYCTHHLHPMSLALVTTLVAIYGADINRRLRRSLRGQPLLVRTSAFVGLCAVGYGWLGVQLASLLRRGLAEVPNHFLPLALASMFVALGLLAERKRKI